jgi:hypothetical protein
MTKNMGMFSAWSRIRFKPCILLKTRKKCLQSRCWPYWLMNWGLYARYHPQLLKCSECQSSLFNKIRTFYRTMLKYGTCSNAIKNKWSIKLHASYTQRWILISSQTLIKASPSSPHNTPLMWCFTGYKVNSRITTTTFLNCFNLKINKSISKSRWLEFVTKMF